MNILVTGGAGYVGSVCSELLVAHSHHVVVLDNLTTGHRGAVPPEALLIEGDVADGGLVKQLVNDHRIDAAMHFAAETLVTGSMTEPQRYFHNNLSKSLALLDALLAAGIDQFIFSSTAAVFGEPRFTPITEDHPTDPINAYGESKLALERVLSWYQRAYGFRYIALRYFNAAGASQLRGENHQPETHLIPLLLDAALKPDFEFTMYGDAYPTPDGTCIRDYVHVLDIAAAHVLALAGLQKGRHGVYNIGSGSGYSVRQVLAAVEATTAKQLPVRIASPRVGDPAVLVASPAKLMAELGWSPRHSELGNIVSSAWQWRLNHPAGYAGQTPAAGATGR